MVFSFVWFLLTSMSHFTPVLVMLLFHQEIFFFHLLFLLTTPFLGIVIQYINWSKPHFYFILSCEHKIQSTHELLFFNTASQVTLPWWEYCSLNFLFISERMLYLEIGKKAYSTERMAYTQIATFIFENF